MEAPAPGVTVLFLLAPLLVGAAAVGLLGPGAFAATLAARPTARALGLAFPAAALTLGVGIALVCLLSLALGESPDLSFGMPDALLLVGLAVLPALVEEWLCRGVLWTACARLTTRGRTIAATAILFALMHVPAWGFLHVPGALFAGVVLGVLRDRTGSLVPGILAHFLNNAVAAALLSG